MENQTRQLLIRFLNNQCSLAEEQEVNRLLEDPETMALLHKLMKEQDDLAEQGSFMSGESGSPRMESWQQRVHERITTAKQSGTGRSADVRSLYRAPLLRYAAVLVGFMMLAGTVWLWLGRTDTSRQIVQQEDILPGQDKAMLTLADGSLISLSDVRSGIIALQQGVQVEKTEDGEVRYRTGDQQQQTAETNTVSTPNGGQYRITLPDGSKAWLNASSSLTYPVQFSDNERRVKMTGEVYFEIARLKKPRSKENVPFYVQTEKQQIRVLGTHFNVNAYNNEPAVRTTLVEGSVRVEARHGQSVLLRPGEQAVLTDNIEVQRADIQQQLAWKDGDFIFKGETLESILRQVARWYDIEVEYPTHLGKLRYNGMISRSQPLSIIVEMLQTNKKVKAALKERRLIVTD